MRTGSLDNAVTITYGVTGDTATEGQDFIGGFGTVTMPAGAASVTVPVTVINDTLGEPTEIFVFSLVNVTGATLWAPRTQRISILDDETPAPPPPAEPPLVSNYNVQEQHIVEGLNQPIKIQFSPVNGNLAYVAEKGGVIKLIDTTTGSVTTVADFSAKVNNAQDRGLMDIVLDPNFASNHYIYSFYVVDPPDSVGKTGLDQQDGAGNRYAQVVRMTLNAAGTAVVAGSEKILVGGAGQSLADISGLGRQNFTDPAFSGAVSSERYNVGVHGEVVIDGIKQDYIKLDSLSHAGGAMAFGPDGALYVAIGDGTSFDYADPRSVDVQNINSLSGKVLRIDPATGLGLPDNPFVTGGMSLASNAAKVFQLGLRNSFSSAFDSDGKLILSNTGWNSWEMINTGGAGANFGWPYYEGGDGGVLLKTPTYSSFSQAQAFYAAVASGTTIVTPPFRAFSHNTFDPGFQVQAITGSSSVYTGNVYPAELKNDWLFLDFSDGEIYSVDVLDSTKVQFLYRTNGTSVPIDFKQGADGYLYYVDIAFGVFGKLQITTISGNPPPQGGITTTIGSGPDALVLKISQDAYQGSAQYTISVDGVQVGGILTASALHGSGQQDTLTVLGNWVAGAHTVAVNFLNDAYGGTAATDRNLYVESATYNGAAVSGAALSLLSAGAQAFGFTDTGTVTPPPTGGTSTTIGSGPDSLVLKISQDAYQGNAQYTILVDGVQIGGVLTVSPGALHSAGVSDTITVLGNWAAGGHNASVNFLNDAYGGTAATDRNLYIDSATYNGAAVPGSTLDLLSAGPRAFSFTDTAGNPPPTGGTGATTTIGTGSDTLVLRISQDAYLGNAQFTISVDGVQVGGIQTASAGALHGAGVTDLFNVLGNWAPGGHSVAVNFLNDAYGGTATTDRNLYLESATYNGTAVPGGVLTLLSAGAQVFSFTDTGTVTPPPTGGASITIGSGPDSLVLKISQDAYQGNAQYTVLVDGVQIGGTLTASAAALHSAGVSDTVTVLGNWAAGGHNASVNFLNDAYGGTPATDRNLYIDSATYNGAAVPGSTLDLLSAGPRAFAFTDTAGTPPPTGGTGTTTTIGTGSDTLVLRLSQDFYQAAAQFTISIDGVQRGGTQTISATALHGSGVTDVFNVLGNFAPGSHTVGINFLNDAYGGTADTDRNLYLESTIYDGAAVGGGVLTLLSAGLQTFTVNDLTPIA